MKILKVNLNNPDEKTINDAVKVLAKGGIIVYPTDTAYGLGCDATNLGAISKLYKLKERNKKKPTHVIVKDLAMAKRYSYIDKTGEILIKNLLPGPLTLILKKKITIPGMLTANLDTVGIRVPKCKVTEAVSEKFSFPYTTPSANVSGGKTPYCIDDTINQLNIKNINLVLDAGKLITNKPSTIINLASKPYRILRQGPITQNQIQKFLGKPV